MNIKPEKIKSLIEIFADLDDNRQKELMRKAIYLKFEQAQEDMLTKEKECTSDLSQKRNDGKRYRIGDAGPMVNDAEVLKNATYKQMHRAVEMVEKIESLTPEHQAAVLVVLNELSKGQLTKEESISITIDSKSLTIQEYLSKHFPRVDVEKAKNLAAAFMSEKKINCNTDASM